MATTIREIGKMIIPGSSGSGSVDEGETVEVMKLNGEVETETETSTEESESSTESDADTSINDAQDTILHQSGSTNTENLTSQQEKTLHTVKYGETITSICKKYYGTDDKKTVLMNMNNLSDEDKIYVGQTLIIP